MSDCNNPPPYIRFLKNALSEEDQTAIMLTDNHLKIDVLLTPFNHLVDMECLLDLSSDHPLGFQVERCPHFLCAYASAFNCSFGPHSKADANCCFLGGYIIKVDKTAVFSPDNISVVIDQHRKQSPVPKKILVRIARDQKVRLFDSRPPALSLRPVDICHIAAINALPLVAGEGMPAS